MTAKYKICNDVVIKTPEQRFIAAQKRAEACGFRTVESTLDWVEGQVGIMIGNKRAIKPKRD